MTTIFYQQRTLLPMDNFSELGSRRPTKSYLRKRERTKFDRTDNISVKDSLERFLADSQDEDLLFVSRKNEDPAIVKGNGRDKTKNVLGDDVDEDDGMTVQSSSLFDRDALKRASSKQTKLKLPRRNSLKHNASEKTRERPRRERRRKTRTPKGDDENNNDGDDNSSGESLASFAIDFDQENEGGVSPPDLEKKSLARRRCGGSQSVTARRQPTRTKSLQGMNRTRTPRRSRSEISGMQRISTNKVRETDNALVGAKALDGLTVDTKDLNRQLRRARMKSEYRNPSPGRYSGLTRKDSWDGNESVESGLSFLTTNTTQSNSTYNPSGLEGGALNAFMANRKGIATPSGGGSVATTPADENFMRERKAQQDMIMDIAMKEKWKLETKGETEEKEQFVATEYYSSDEELGEKKKGLVKKMKKAARKTAKLSRSGVKGAANVVLDPKRTAKRAGKVASKVGKQTTKMVLDPSLAAKRGTKGIKDTVTYTASVAKEGFDKTTSLTKKGIKGTAKVAGETIEAAGRAMSEATEILFQHDNEQEEVLKDYDPRDLSDRGLETFAERLSLNGKKKKSKNRIRKRSMSPKSEILVPALELNEFKELKKSNDWWDF